MPPRLIPCLLLRGAGVVKTVRFRDPTYLGDPINIVRIFNEKEVDELVLLDITATVEGRGPRFELVEQIASECFMPLCYGGGIRDIEDMRRLFGAGVEKVALNARAVESPGLVRAAADRFGSQSIVVSMDVRRSMLGRYEVHTHAGRRATGLDPGAHARNVEALGAGEILLTSIDRDGTMKGYDLALLSRVAASVRIPVVTSGGAGNLRHVREAVKQGGASAAAAGSMFVFQGPLRGILISYPGRAEVEEALR